MHSSKIKVKLGPTQETLMIPLFARAIETKRKQGLLNDPKAVEIVDSVDYDFDKWKNSLTLIGATIRTLMFDKEVSHFLSKHPNGTIIEIGTGLNTRYERLNNDKAQWLELDLPDSLALRRHFFSDTKNRKMIEANAQNTDWFQEVLKYPAPYCFVSEAVFIYLDNPYVEKTLQAMSLSFPQAQFIIDTTSSSLVNRQHKHDLMSKMSKDSWFRWRCDDPSSLEKLGLNLESSSILLDAPQDIRNSLPMIYWLVFQYAPWLIRYRIDGYKINRFKFKPL